MFFPARHHVRLRLLGAVFLLGLLLPVRAVALGPAPGVAASLTPIEEAITASLAQEPPESADHLFDLALFASGNRRNVDDYNRYRKRLARFLQRVTPQLNRARNDRIKGAVLFKAMRREFLKSSPGKPLSGYDEDQSRLTELLDTGRYNCLSSALLYMILAQKAGLKAYGVLLPSHVFVQLNLPGGKVVEVETTNGAGYGIHHTRAFYKQEGRRWADRRGVTAITYRDYLNRTLLTPAQLVGLAMNAQHTSDKRMNDEDRARLHETWGAMDPGRKKAQEARLGVYIKKFQRLHKEKNYSAARTLFEAVLPVFETVRKTWPEEEEVRRLAAWGRFSYALSLVKTGTKEGGLKWVRRSLAIIPDPAGEDKSLLRNNLTLIQGRTKELAQEKRFDQALALHREFAAQCRMPDVCVEILPWIYEQWALDLMDRGAWREAVSRFDQQLLAMRAGGASGGGQRQERVRVLKNIGAAYGQWVNALWDGGDWERVVSILDKQSRRMAGLDGGKRIRDNLEKAYRNWLNSRRLHQDAPGAEAVLAHCRKNHPDLDFCRAS